MVCAPLLTRSLYYLQSVSLFRQSCLCSNSCTAPDLLYSSDSGISNTFLNLFFRLSKISPTSLKLAFIVDMIESLILEYVAPFFLFLWIQKFTFCFFPFRPFPGRLLPFSYLLGFKHWNCRYQQNYYLNFYQNTFFCS